MNATEEPKVNEFSFSIHKRWAQSTIETPIGVEVRPGLPNPRLQVADGRPISEVDLARREIVGARAWPLPLRPTPSERNIRIHDSAFSKLTSSMLLSYVRIVLRILCLIGAGISLGTSSHVQYTVDHSSGWTLDRNKPGIYPLLRLITISAFALIIEIGFSLASGIDMIYRAEGSAAPLLSFVSLVLACVLAGIGGQVLENLGHPEETVLQICKMQSERKALTLASPNYKLMCGEIKTSAYCLLALAGLEMLIFITVLVGALRTQGLLPKPL